MSTIRRKALGLGRDLTVRSPVQVDNCEPADGGLGTDTFLQDVLKVTP